MSLEVVALCQWTFIMLNCFAPEDGGVFVILKGFFYIKMRSFKSQELSHKI